MIVQCEHCQTRYRIPDEKVKGKAAKVRCAKCDNTFTIHPESGTPAAASPEQAPPVTEAAPPEPPPESDTESTRETEPPPLSSPQDTTVSSTEASMEPNAEYPDTPATVSGAESAQAGPGMDDLPESSPDTYEPPPFPEDTDAGGSHRPAHEIDKDDHAAPVEDEVPEPEPGEFELETTSREDKLEPLQIPASPQGESFPGTSSSIDDEMGWGNISLDSEPEKQADGEGINLAEGTGFQPPPPPPPIFDEGLPEGSQPETEPMLDLPSTPSYTPETVAPKKARMGLLILLVLAALGAGGYFVYPKVMEIINPQGEQPVGTLTPDKIQVRSLSREDGNLIYTVRGTVKNESSGSVGMVQVEAQFRNAAGTIVAKATVYCGNIFDDKEIISGDLGKVLADLQNELGQSLSNSGIQPGQDVPFLIVLENPPPDVSKVTVTISGFKETT